MLDAYLIGVPLRETSFLPLIMGFSNLSSAARIYIVAFVALCVILFSLTSSSFPSVRQQVYDLASTSSSKNATQPSWLLITSSASSDFQRRLIVRWTWVNLFRGSGIFDNIFAVTCSDPVLLPLLQKENETYGDILLIDNIEDTWWTANHIKPFEVLKKVTDEGWKGKTYDFVSKVDSDSLVDPVRTWDKYLKDVPITGRAEDRIMLSMPHDEFCGCPAPQGGFYTLSWDLGRAIAAEYDKVKDKQSVDVEDCMVGRFPTNAGEQYKFIPMTRDESFDVIGEEPDAIAREWSEEETEIQLERLKDVVFLHQMKEEWKWMIVKDLFDKDGWVPNRVSNSTTSLLAYTKSED